MSQVMSGCLGPGEYHRYLTQVSAARRRCDAQPAASLLSGRRSSFSSYSFYDPYSTEQNTVATDTSGDRIFNYNPNSIRDDFGQGRSHHSSRMPLSISFEDPRQQRDDLGDGDDKRLPAYDQVTYSRQPRESSAQVYPRPSRVPNTQINLGTQSGRPIIFPDTSYRPPIYQSPPQQVFPGGDVGGGGVGGSWERVWDSHLLGHSFSVVNAALSNLTCVAASVNAIDGDLNIKFDSFFNYYNTRPVDQLLRADLADGVNFCRAFTECLPVEKLKTPLPWKLQRFLAFLKCERKLRLASCFKHDLRSNLAYFDLSALPDEGGRSSGIDVLMTVLVGADSVDDLQMF
nr:uncharacterized protein LOC128684084 [Cherax quadricarinatus]